MEYSIKSGTGKMKKYIAFVLLLFIIYGCHTAYVSKGLFGGYSDTRIDENMFIVTFKGNGYTSTSRSADYALLRCSELCKENGFSYFKIIDDKADKSHDITFWGGSGYDTSKPSNRNTIICFKDKPEGVSYNAEWIIKSLKEKYDIE
jgi:hypothetical protein